MFKKLSHGARSAFNYAGSEAIHLGATTIGSEHLLLGILCAEEKPLVHLQVEQVRQIAKRLPHHADHSPTLGYSSETIELLHDAEEKAQGQTVDLVHLWQAIVDHPQSRACQVLVGAQIDLEEVRQVVEQDLDGQPALTQPEKDHPLAGMLVDLCQLAEEGKLAPVVGRAAETQQILTSLMRWSKNAPVLVGHPGVGKTAVVEGLAYRISQGDVPEQLRDCRILSLNLAALVAGTRYRGDLEDRVKTLLQYLSADRNLILFVDEIHQLLGAGASENSMDLGGMLKPVLARGDIRLIGATTEEEYNKRLEKDPAFERRLQPILVEEPSQEETVQILLGLKARLESHHQVMVDELAVEEAVLLGGEYMPARFFPDKAVDVLDQACAICALSDSQRVDAGRVREVVAAWSGIPAQELAFAAGGGIRELPERLRSGLVGQDEAIERVCRCLIRQSAGLGEQHKPNGSFLFLGPTGVGKTELCRLLAAQLFHSPQALVRLDMSEFSEKHDLSKLIGSPPGYVGHGQGGYLINALKRRPASVVVFDEIEKAHPDIAQALLQILEEGQLRDGSGKTVSFQNTVVVLTSNLGARWAEHAKPRLGFQSDDTQELLDSRQEKVMEEVSRFFAPELLGRLDEIILFQPLAEQELQKIVELGLERIAERLSQRDIKLSWNKGVPGWILEQRKDLQGGARGIQSLLRRQIEEPLSQAVVEHPEHIRRIRLGQNKQGLQIKIAD